MTHQCIGLLPRGPTVELVNGSTLLLDFVAVGAGVQAFSLLNTLNSFL